ncbi:MAG: tRNA (adenosine(37)-N6)-threonylcarbamoyltransferase complex ATPase subunit type 1 TsaE [Candidatus Nealsonbacteria bacterium CG_4_10_14_0_2_um_filter_40_15]|uniref:tRNA threonylcarbamoyladenosine biosynthesis protein TsaE n=1 Tax=Candidatus Nealsonbacteria bacterium CG_4_10_14_0_2_um_filter_40_15 TaxID=1974682 RepID=A0A2M7UUR2_9BACT|nr:MAG: tRNA (adenosine(37)-N6)-threonylcarbamoyltransferase complex ATPase subunit type 1 TsaE [Candidatus Nealsonbacteria bacterium CG_4_10_14_0_2_um_filter_40_15]
MKIEYLTENPTQTKKIGEILAKKILKTRIGTRALVLGLEGDLGGGKTTFLQGFAKGLGVKEKITSPTFVIIKRFHIPSSIFHDFYHIDCYRIRKAKEIFDLGFKEMISNPRHIVAIEWADRIKKILPKNVLLLKFGFVGKTSRKITIQSQK